MLSTTARLGGDCDGFAPRERWPPREAFRAVWEIGLRCVTWKTFHVELVPELRAPARNEGAGFVRNCDASLLENAANTKKADQVPKAKAEAEFGAHDGMLFCFVGTNINKEIGSPKQPQQRMKRNG